MRAHGEPLMQASLGAPFGGTCGTRGSAGETDRVGHGRLDGVVFDSNLCSGATHRWGGVRRRFDGFHSCRHGAGCHP